MNERPYNSEQYEAHTPAKAETHMFCTGGPCSAAYGPTEPDGPTFPVKHKGHAWVGDATCQAHATPELWAVLTGA